MTDSRNELFVPQVWGVPTDVMNNYAGYGKVCAAMYLRAIKRHLLYLLALTPRGLIITQLQYSLTTPTRCSPNIENEYGSYCARPQRESQDWSEWESVCVG
jgi:hypothetical protein